MEQPYWPDEQLAQRLWEERTQTYVGWGFPLAEAQQKADNDVDCARDMCIETDELGKQPDPEWLFTAAEHDPDIREYLLAARADGVTDEDIRAWHGRPHLERSLLLFGWQQEMMSALLWGNQRRIEDGGAMNPGSVDRIAIWSVAELWTRRPAPAQPLPAELYARYCNWSRSRSLEEDALESELAVHGSINAIIRAAVASGAM